MRDKCRGRRPFPLAVGHHSDVGVFGVGAGLFSLEVSPQIFGSGVGERVLGGIEPYTSGSGRPLLVVGSRLQLLCYG